MGRIIGLSPRDPPSAADLRALRRIRWPRVPPIVLLVTYLPAILLASGCGADPGTVTRLGMWLGLVSSVLLTLSFCPRCWRLFHVGGGWRSTRLACSDAG